MNDCSEGESDHYRGQDTDDDRKGFFVVDVGAETDDGSGRHPQLVSGGNHRSTEKLENDRYRGRSRKTERIKGIQKKNICQHHRKKDEHDIPIGKELRIKNPASRNFHHSA